VDEEMAIERREFIQARLPPRMTLNLALFIASPSLKLRLGKFLGHAMSLETGDGIATQDFKLILSAADRVEKAYNSMAVQSDSVIVDIR